MDEESISKLLENIPKMILPSENKNLLKPFIEVEITFIIWGMELNKALALDGFSFHFYRTYVNIIKKDLIRMITSFQ